MTITAVSKAMESGFQSLHAREGLGLVTAIFIYSKEALNRRVIVWLYHTVDVLQGQAIRKFLNQKSRGIKKCFMYTIPCRKKSELTKTASRRLKRRLRCGSIMILSKPAHLRRTCKLNWLGFLNEIALEPPLAPFKSSGRVSGSPAPKPGWINITLSTVHIHHANQSTPKWNHRHLQQRLPDNEYLLEQTKTFQLFWNEARGGGNRILAIRSFPEQPFEREMAVCRSFAKIGWWFYALQRF